MSDIEFEFEHDYDYDYGYDHEPEEEEAEEVEVQSPGVLILKAVDTHLPPCSPLKLAVTTNCLVEDLSIVFPQVQIEMGRATVGGVETCVPIICDLQIFNSPLIGRFVEDCKTISNAVFLEGSVKRHEWYQLLLKEITDALNIYVRNFPLTEGNTSMGPIKVYSNFSFEIPSGEKQKVLINYRLPNYEKKFTLKSKFNVKKKVFESYGIKASDEELVKIAESYPVAGLPRPVTGQIKCSNKRILDWVYNDLPYELVDFCFEGIFSKSTDRIKVTINNNTDDPIIVNIGEEIGSMVF